MLQADLIHLSFAIGWENGRRLDWQPPATSTRHMGASLTDCGAGRAKLLSR